MDSFSSDYKHEAKAKKTTRTVTLNHSGNSHLDSVFATLTGRVLEENGDELLIEVTTANNDQMRVWWNRAYVSGLE